MMSIIQEYNNHLEEIFENSYDYIYLHDKEGNILDVNDVIVRNLGYSKKEIYKMKVTDFLLEEVPSIISDEIKKAIETGIVKIPKTYKVKRKNGGIIYVEANTIPLKKDGKFYAILGIGHDVTAYMEVEENLKASEEQYRMLVETSGEIISLINHIGKPIFVNKAAYNVLGYSNEEFLSTKGYDLVHPEDINHLNSSMFTVMKGGSVNNLEYRILHKDGMYKYLQSTFKPIFNSDGKLDKVLVVSRDVTSQKKIESKLKKSEEKYRLITENANDLIRVLNDKFEIEFVNESAHFNALGYLKEELVGRTAIFLNHPDEYTQIRHFLRKVSKSGEGTHELRIRHRNSIWIWFEIKVKMLKDERGNTKYLFISRDITDRRKNEHKLKDHAKTLEILNWIITLGNESISLQEFLNKSFDHVLDNVNFDRGGVFLYNPKTQHNKLILHKNVHPEFVGAVKNIDVSKGSAIKIFDKNNPYYIEDFSEFMEGSKELGIRSALIVPLRSKDQYVGSLNVGSPIHQVLSQNELELLVAIGKQMGIIIQKFESEELLKESEMKFRNLFENARDGILLAERESRKFLTGNKRICEMLGYSLEEIESLAVPDIHPKEKLSNIVEQFDKQIRGEIDTAKDIPVRRKDDSIFYVDINASQIQLGNKFYQIGIFRDITERKQTEHMLEDRAKKLELLNDIIITGNQAPDKETLMKSILKLSINMMDFDGGGIYLIDDNKNEASLKYHRGIPQDFVESAQTILIDKNPYKQIFLDNKPLFSENYPDINPEVYEKWGFLSVASVPLYSKKKVLGAMNITSKKRYFFTTEEKIILQSVGRQMGTAIEKIQAEQKLKESEVKFRRIFESIPDLFFLVSGDGTILDYKGNIEDLNFPPETFLSKKIIESLPKKIADLSLTNIRKTLETHEPQIVDFNLQINGSIRYFEARYLYFSEEQVLIFIRDITERKQAVQNIKESEEKFRVMSEQSFMSIMVVQDGIIKYFNDRLPSRIGYSAEEIKSWEPNEFAKVIHPDDREIVMEQAEKKQKGHKDVMSNYKYRSIRKDGEIRWVENFSKTINFDGRHADLVMSIDITDNLKAEKSLRESEEKFRNIAEQSFMGIVIIQDGELKYTNKALSEISGYSIEEMLKMSQKDILKNIFPEDINYLSKRLQKNIKSTMNPFSINTFRIFDKNGDIRWLEDYTSKIIYQGKPANLISLIDITDKKEAEQLIVEENKRLLELHELRKDIITRVSHELKTPMTSIYGAYQILIKLYMNEIGEEAQKYIEIGHRGSLRLKQLIDNLLDVSKLDAKKIELKLQNENLIDLLIDSVKDMNYLAINRQLKLKLDLPNEAYIEIDRLRFRQVLSNIISNAIKNTPTEGEIFIDLIEQPDYIDIQVKDTGVGITEKEREKLFEKFGKIERYGMDLGVDIEGSGLGLYISKEIVALHGGQIIVESEGRNKGSIFTIRLFKK